MEKLKMHSTNAVNSNIDALEQLFPDCITESIDENGQTVKAVDFDKLKASLSYKVVQGDDERYNFTWPQKSDAIRLANSRTSMTLRPCRKESLDFDNTGNLYIEGDNLDVLKVLRHTYRSRVKMIYIDPPYNTGNDFVYEDDFTIESDEFLQISGQKDQEGNRLVLNSNTNGRFHTDWLNMIYPRLKLARELLSDDGVIFISIDNNELDNLIKLCNEVFGETNKLSNIIWISGRTAASHFTNSHEYIIAYAKSVNHLGFFEYKGSESVISDRAIKAISNKNPASEITFPAGIDFDSDDRLFPNEIGGKEKSFVVKGQLKCVERKLAETVTIKAGWAMKDQILSWLQGADVVDSKGQKILRFFFKSNGILQYEKLKGSIHPSSVIKDIPTKEGTNEVIRLLGEKIFSYPKPVRLVEYLALMLGKDDIVLDFFSGSASTAHAVMHMNATDGGNRKFIMVQLPEELPKDSEGYKAGYKNICEIGKERIRRAGTTIKTELGEKAKDLDIGFRVLKLDSSNMDDAFYLPNQMTMESLVSDNIKQDRTSEDLLFQTMLETDVLLSSSISIEHINNKEVFVVRDGYLMACFDEQIDLATVKAIAERKPVYFITRDGSMASDDVADNMEQIFMAISPNTNIKVL